MPREMIWMDKLDFVGFGCSQCAWVFKPSGALLTGDLDKMKTAYEIQRDQEFAAHRCADFPKGDRP